MSMTQRIFNFLWPVVYIPNARATYISDRQKGSAGSGNLRMMILLGVPLALLEVEDVLIEIGASC